MQDILKSNTPAFVFDTAALKKRVAQIKEIVGETVSLCYSMKANPFFVPAMITCVDKLEVCSPGELTICKKLGVDASRIIYSGVNKEIPDIKEAYEYGVGTFTAESVRQADLIQQVVETAAAGEKAEVILRLNSGSQFGMSKDDLLTILQCRESRYTSLNFTGIHYFVGTQRKRAKRKIKELQMLLELFEEIRNKCGLELKKLEYGPGFAVPYFEDDDFEDTLYPVKELKDTLKQVAQQVDLTIEMGRFFTAECGTYYTNVADLKTVGNAHYCILDGGMNHLTYLGQMMGMKTPIIKHAKNTSKQEERPEKKTWCLCGSLCTTSDILCREVELNHLEIGDTLIFENVGAYSVTEGIYLFLSRTLPKVYLKDENGYLTLVRDAIETSEINI